MKKLEKSENLSEDVIKDNQDKIQKVTDKFTKTVETLVEEKETAKGHNYVDGICESCGLSEDFSLSYSFDNDGTVHELPY